MKAELESLTLYPDTDGVDATVRVFLFGAERTLRLSGTLNSSEPVLPMPQPVAPAPVEAQPEEPSDPPPALPEPKSTKVESAKPALESWFDSIVAVLDLDARNKFTRTELWDAVLNRRIGSPLHHRIKDRQATYQNFYNALATALRKGKAKKVLDEGLDKIQKAVA